MIDIYLYHKAYLFQIHNQQVYVFHLYNIYLLKIYTSECIYFKDIKIIV